MASEATAYVTIDGEIYPTWPIVADLLRVVSEERDQLRTALESTHIGGPIPLAVRFLTVNCPDAPVLEWVRLASGKYVVLAGTADNYDSYWFDEQRQHPKSQLIFADKPGEKS